MGRFGRDVDATTVLVETARRLHSVGRPDEDDVRLLPLRDWFDALLRGTPADPLLAQCAKVARRLLDAPSGIDPGVLADWVVAWCGLSIVWEVLDGSWSWHAATARDVAEVLLAAQRAR